MKMLKLMRQMFGAKNEAVQGYETGAADVRSLLASAARDLGAEDFDQAVISLVCAQALLTELRREIELQAALASLRSAVKPS